MQGSSMNLRPNLRLTLSGLLLTACCVGWSTPAPAFGMGGRGGGFGGPAVGGAPAARAVATPQPGAAGIVGRPSGWNPNAARNPGGNVNVYVAPRHGGHYPRTNASDPPTRGGRYPVPTIYGQPTPGSRGSGTQVSGLPKGSGSGGVGGVGAGGAGRGGGGNGGSGVPPRGERRFVPDEVITAFSASTTPEAIEQLARRYNLTRLETQSFPLINTTFYRWRIGGRRSVPDVVGTIEDERIVARAQPNYVFTLQEDAAKISSGTRGDAAQYVLARLEIEQAHRVSTGKDIPVALIDSEIDVKHPDLDGAIAKTFDALTGDERPHQHGTAIAGAIAAHAKLLGIAPGAQLLAARAFDDTPGEAKGTSFAIYKSLQWAADNAARVVNMSFAGPADPTLHQMLTAAYEKGIVLIAAAGNAGPNSPPLYPAADPDVIAVTATDSHGGVFKMANRGPYIAVAAPGVDILALAPGEAYQITTGTSVAAAHVAGVAALLLESKPSLKPADIRSILTSTAKPPGSAARNADAGAGQVDAYRAVASLTTSARKTGEQAKQ